MDTFSLLGVSPEDAARMTRMAKEKGRRDSRICVCGHAGGAHSPLRVKPGEENKDIIEFKFGEIVCQAGKTPCACERFQWVATAQDVRSFIYKTEGAGPLHALTKGAIASEMRGKEVTWREDLVCFTCLKPSSEVGPLIAIAYNERKGEAHRSTNMNRLHCETCRDLTRAEAANL